MALLGQSGGSTLNLSMASHHAFTPDHTGASGANVGALSARRIVDLGAASVSPAHHRSPLASQRPNRAESIVSAMLVTPEPAASRIASLRQMSRVVGSFRFSRRRSSPLAGAGGSATPASFRRRFSSRASPPMTGDSRGTLYAGDTPNSGASQAVTLPGPRYGHGPSPAAQRALFQLSSSMRSIMSDGGDDDDAASRITDTTAPGDAPSEATHTPASMRSRAASLLTQDVGVGGGAGREGRLPFDTEVGVLQLGVWAAAFNTGFNLVEFAQDVLPQVTGWYWYALSPKAILDAMGEWIAIEGGVCPPDSTGSGLGSPAARDKRRGSSGGGGAGSAPKRRRSLRSRLPTFARLPTGAASLPEAKPEDVGWTRGLFDQFTSFVSNNGIPAPLSSIEHRMLRVVLRRWMRCVSRAHQIPLLCAMAAYVRVFGFALRVAPRACGWPSFASLGTSPGVVVCAAVVLLLLLLTQVPDVRTSGAASTSRWQRCRQRVVTGP